MQSIGKLTKGKREIRGREYLSLVNTAFKSSKEIETVILLTFKNFSVSLQAVTAKKIARPIHLKPRSFTAFAR